MLQFVLILLLQNCCHAAPIGEVSGNLLGTATFVSDIMVLMSYILSLVFFLTAIMQFRMHRNNPKIVPLINVIFSLALAIVIGAIPYMAIHQESSSAQYQYEGNRNIVNNPNNSIKKESKEKLKHWSEK